jgi:hypothetical protein
MLQASQIPVSLDALLPHNEALFKKEVARALGVKVAQLEDVCLIKRSIDARKRSQVHGVVMVAVRVVAGAKVRPARGVQVKSYEPPDPLKIPQVAYLSRAVNVAEEPSEQAGEPAGEQAGEPAGEPASKVGKVDKAGKAGKASKASKVGKVGKAGAHEATPFLRPVVVGTGPAGLFCAWYLAQAGLRPLVVERGAAVEDRLAAIEAFNEGGPLNPLTNVQFGEGGAGTFSDGKLNTGIKSPHIRHVLETFVACGAPAEILVDSKPHIGTDLLVGVVRTLRERIIEAGGEVRFLTQLVGFDEEEGTLVAAFLRDELTGAVERVATSRVILACGHSARDTFEMLQKAQVPLERKPFAVGVRIEHPQRLIDEAQYGTFAGHPALGAADYKLAVKTKEGRGVYTFCMCPGGEVVAAASEEGGVCVNGMSYHARAAANANSALLVEVHPEDLPGTDPLKGVAFQRELERAAYKLGRGEVLVKQGVEGHEPGRGEIQGEQGTEGLSEDASEGQYAPYTAPVQTVADFMANTHGHPSAEVSPSYPRGIRWANMRDCLPPFVVQAYLEAFPLLERKLHGFSLPGAVMTGVEARSSSPVRIVRDATFQAQVRGLYPCGEGAGYAGGIMSAAVDGLRVAEAVVQEYLAEAEGEKASEGALEETSEKLSETAPERADEKALCTASSLSQKAALTALRAGRVVAFPTDTVCGIGVLTEATSSPAALFEVKGRPANKPVAWLVDSPCALDTYGKDVPAYAHKLARAFWPGALTLVVRASAQVGKGFQSKEGTIGLRMPHECAASDLIREVGCPLAVTSANVSGEAAPVQTAFLNEALRERIAGVYDPCRSASHKATYTAPAAPAPSSSLTKEESDALSSTVIDCTGPCPRILRQGSLSQEALKGVLHE